MGALAPFKKNTNSNFMKKILILLAIFTTVATTAQSVGINADGSAANASAMLDVSSTTKGLLPPRMTRAQRNAIASPVAAGLQVWCTDCGTYGETQVYNGSTWTNMIGGASSGTVPGAPTSPVATAGNAQASVAFTAPASNGGSAITGYTVTSSPGGLTATGTSSPKVVTGLTNGTAYTFTVVATNAIGNSVASVASNSIKNCGAYVAAGVWKAFQCYNLGAIYTTTSDYTLPVQDHHGNYYQWGRNTVVATSSTGGSGTISGWNTTVALDNSWGTSGGDNIKNLTNDPCPTGFRVPTNVEWQGVLNTSLNTVSRTGSWLDSSSNFTTAISFGTPTIKTLTLPAAGCRYYLDGELTNRGLSGYYWSSTENGTNAWNLNFFSSVATTGNINRTFGFSVRCILE
jgi:uncharacterized protein (TIGR02145 family)